MFTKYAVLGDFEINIGRLNVHELFWMLQCNFNASNTRSI